MSSGSDTRSPWQLNMNGPERARYGMIVSFENEHGQTLTLHRVGSPRKALEAAIEQALALDETFRIVAVSTPSTIYQDLQGMRSPSGGHADKNVSGVPAVPEQSACSGRLRAMLHPRFLVTFGQRRSR